MIFLRNYFLKTTAEIDVISIIHEVKRAIRESTVVEGGATVFVPEPGAGLAIIEPLPEIVARFEEALGPFTLDAGIAKSRWKEEIPIGPRVAAALLGKGIHLLVHGGQLLIGPREEVVLVDFEGQGRRREVCVQVMGDPPPAPQQGQTGRRR